MFVDLSQQVERIKREILDLPRSINNHILINPHQLVSAFDRIEASLKIAERQIFEALGGHHNIPGSI